MIVAHFKRHGPKWAGAGVGICAAFLVVREGYEPVAKHERVDPPSVITWCYGETNVGGDGNVKPGTRFTKDECASHLPDLLQKYAAPLQECLPGFDTYPPHRQAALVSFAYNLGTSRVCKSSVGRNLRAGNVKAGCDAMLAYTRANRVVLKGLVNRRNAERAMCLRSD